MRYMQNYVETKKECDFLLGWGYFAFLLTYLFHIEQDFEWKVFSNALFVFFFQH